MFYAFNVSFSKTAYLKVENWTNLVLNSLFPINGQIQFANFETSEKNDQKLE